MERYTDSENADNKVFAEEPPAQSNAVTESPEATIVVTTFEDIWKVAFHHTLTKSTVDRPQL